jgi:hypothetical protein
VYKVPDDVNTWGMDGIERVVCVKPQFKAADANEEVEGRVFDWGEDILFRALVENRSDCTSHRRSLRKANNPNEWSLSSIVVSK